MCNQQGARFPFAEAVRQGRKVFVPGGDFRGLELGRHRDRLAAGRPARPREVREALEFLATQPRREFALTLLNLNSFLYVN